MAPRSISAPSPSESFSCDVQQDHEHEARIFGICARAGVCCIGIQRGFGLAVDYALFQPTVTTLAIPLVEFADPDRAIALIKEKLAQAGAK